MAYTTINDPSAFFQCALYSGDGSSDLAITNNGNSDLQPDLVWLKERSSTSDHGIYDSVRGAGAHLEPNKNTAVDANATEQLSSFNTDGFNVGSSGLSNEDGETYVAWQWKAGTSFSNDASSTSVGTIDSAGSVNQDAGFSIISYTGTGSAATVAHGLGSAPRTIWIKDTSNARDWGVYHEDIANVNALYLDLNNEKGGNNAGFWNSTSPTSSVFSINTRNEVNASSANMIAYCFAEKQGFSKFGSYTGNGSTTNNAFIYTGFRPAWFMCKRTDGAGSWAIFDNKREPFNDGANSNMISDDNNAENTNDYNVEFFSNGIKPNASSDNIGRNAAAYVYWAFAASPFVTSTGIPTTAV